MSTFNDVIRNTQDTIDAAEKRRASYKAESKLIIDKASQANRASLSPAEAARVDEALRQMDALDEKIRNARRTLEAVKAEAEADERLTRLSAESRPGADASGRTASFGIGRNERQYGQHNDPTGRNFLLDIARDYLFNDVQAHDRLSRHMAEERVERPMLERSSVGVGTGAFTGLTVPQYLTDLYAPAVANMRPFANVMNYHPLPDSGMSLNLSRITTASSAGLQATELSAVSFTDMDDTLLTINVQTMAGQQLVSRQAIERGTGVEDVTTQDLFKRLATLTDSTVLTQAATGLTNTAQVTTYTSASPTAAEFWPFIFQAESKLEQALLAQARVNYVVMHPRRWNWLCAQVGSSWPFLGAQGSGVATQQGAMQVTNEYGPSVRGVLSNGLKVCVDANVPTGGGQDEVYVVASDECHLWEDANAPVLIRAEQPQAASLGILLVAYSYVAYSFGRYANNPGKISGTGLAAPAGF